MEELIEELTQQFSNSIPKEEEKLCVAFKEYLLSAKINLENSNSKFILKDEKSISKVLKSIANRLISEELWAKKKELLIDENFYTLNGISIYINQLAEDVLVGKKIKLEFDINEKIEEINDLLDSVEEYNELNAKYLASEAILDLKFIENPQTDIISLRLNRMKQLMKNSDKNNEDSNNSIMFY